ncbi:MAG: ATP-dependent helicase HrpB [Polyangiales bacterium]
MALPIDDFLASITAALADTGAVVIVAEPGAGKTTRVPRALLEGTRADDGEVWVLEPRRLAARMAAARVAEELGEALGERVGVQVRFETVASARTRLRFVTEGVLLRRLSEDPALDGIAAVVFDEFHERSVASDLGLALVQHARRGARPDLRVVVMSATLDPAPVAAFLAAGVVRVPGRAFPVEVRFADRDDPRPLEERVAAGVRRALAQSPGDVLVFLPGAAEIRRAAERCAEVVQHVGAELALLHGDLPAREQDQAVRAGARRKVILSTNVAESSVTIPTVTHVLDSGLARVLRSTPWTGLSSLVTERVSRARADQRAGRAGRVSAGTCERLYTRHDYDARDAQDAPEVARAELAEALLLLVTLGHDPRRFAFFETPPEAARRAALELLARLGALTVEAETCAATPLGRKLAALPTHPRLGRLLVSANEQGAGARGALLAALVAERDIRRGVGAALGRGGGRARERVEDSDLIDQLEAFEEAEAHGFSGAALRRLELDGAQLQTVRKSRDQLARTLRLPRSPEAPLDEERSALTRAVLLGFPDRVGKRREPGRPAVVFAGGGSGELAPESVVREATFMVCVDVWQKGPRAVVARASAIDAEDLLDAFPDQVESYVQTRFDARLEQVEQVSGLRYEGLVLDESVRRDGQGEEVADCLARAAVSAGLHRFVDMDELMLFQHRVAFARKHGVDAPPVDDERVVEALRLLCAGRRTFADLKGLALVPTLLGMLEPKVQQALFAVAPESVPLPGRARVPLHYEAERDPWIESRMQDFFGLTEGPRVARGEVPLVLHLLAPNRRAVQVTTDLAGFWQRHYPRLAAELRRRYPRHPFPEDPTQRVRAEPR